MTTTVMEMVNFTLKPGTDNAQWLASAAELEGFLHQQSGFLYRALTQDEQGLWYDVVYWQDMDAAVAGGKAFMASSQGQQMCQFIALETVKVRHMPVSVEVMSCHGAD